MTLNRYLFSILLSLVSLANYAQNSTSSTYSRFGLGLIESKTNTTSAGMGHTGVAISSSDYLNFLNPASYSALDSARFIFNLQGKISFANYATPSASQKNIDANIESIGIGFRAGNKWGMGFSVSPYSSVGYTISGEKYILGTQDKYPVAYLGEGGLSQLSWYNGFEITKGLSLGLTASYLWGSKDIIEVSYYPSLIGETTFNERNYHVSTLLLQYGVQWHQKVKTSVLSAGISINMPTELNSHYTQRIYNSHTTDLSSVQKNMDNTFIPLGYRAGLAIQTFKGWTFAGDFSYDNWSQSELTIADGSTRDTYAGSLGIEHRPTRLYPSYFKNIQYRAGAFYNQEYLSIKGQAIDSKGLTAGLTLPIRGNSAIDIAYEYKLTGTNQAGLVKEQLNTIRLNLSFSENWFQKRQFK
ncbi:hypothetical protein [Carboxylicivirga taeanensis]|uniref:hypothetical protein n=1 Tax=Carboxylicivirga taeanensis TaxID=1416875 RepID=UPI003F6DD921